MDYSMDKKIKEKYKNNYRIDFDKMNTQIIF